MPDPRRTVAMAPARRHMKQPYNALLCDALEGEGLKVIDVFPSWILRPWQAKTVHFHWPEYHFRRRLGVLVVIALAVSLSIHRLMKGTVVQTIHNVTPHDGYRSTIERVGVHMIDRFTTRVMVHSATVLDAVQRERPNLSIADAIVIPLPLYPYNPTDGARDRVRRDLGLSDPSDVLCVHFGLLRAYKGTLELAAVWTNSRPQGAILCIWGKADDQMESALRASAEVDSTISLDPNFIPEQRLHDLLAAADLAVLPYHQIYTSASVALAAAAQCPVLVPASDSMKEVQTLAGADLIMTYSGGLTSSLLIGAIDDVRQRCRPHIETSLFPTYTELAAATKLLYLP